MEVALILLLSVVIPIWLVLHYVTQWKKNKSITPQDEVTLSDIRRSAEKIEDRLKTMERILDEEVPGWRSRYDDEF